MKKSRIDWCDSSWNPVTGCFHDCKYCYARRIANRFGGASETHSNEAVWKECQWMTEATGEVHVLNVPVYDYDRGHNAPYPFEFDPTFHKYRLKDYEKITGRNIFVCSMADLFGKWVPDEWIQEVFQACDRADRNNYLFLTKNPGRYIELADKGLLPGRHWYGYSATKQADLWEFTHADDCPVTNLFVSIEPILEPIKPAFCSHCPADWVIVGAETGNRKEKVIPRREWIEEIVTICEYSGIPLFMKSSLAEIWEKPLIQQFPDQLKKGGSE